jgi:hypothetical protein
LIQVNSRTAVMAFSAAAKAVGMNPITRGFRSRRQEQTPKDRVRDRSATRHRLPHLKTFELRMLKIKLVVVGARVRSA